MGRKGRGAELTRSARHRSGGSEGRSSTGSVGTVEQEGREAPPRPTHSSKGYRRLAVRLLAGVVSRRRSEDYTMQNPIRIYSLAHHPSTHTHTPSSSSSRVMLDHDEPDPTGAGSVERPSTRERRDPVVVLQHSTHDHARQRREKGRGQRSAAGEDGMGRQRWSGGTVKEEWERKGTHEVVVCCAIDTTTGQSREVENGHSQLGTKTRRRPRGRAGAARRTSDVRSEPSPWAN